MTHPHIDLPQQRTQTYRYRGHVSPQEAQERGARAEAAITQDGDQAVLRIYDVIDSWGGIWGISAKEITAALDSLESVSAIQVRLNSPGGDAFEGIAIYNALAAYDAPVNVVVDGLAASAASIIAMAGDTIEMQTGSQLMIHDAWLLTVGNAEDLRSDAEMLDHLSDNLAAVYAERAGGRAATWRKAMKAESWYSPQEAVDAGLATKVIKKDKTSTSKAAFDLSVFNFAGRDEAPAPLLDTKIENSRASVPGKQDQENHRVNAEQLQTIGLAEDATDDEVSARLAALVANQIEEPEPEVETEESDDEGDDTTDDVEEHKPAPTAPESVTVDRATFDALVKSNEANSKALARMNKDSADKERTDFLNAAMKTGRFRASEREGYEAFYESNPAAARKHIENLAPNTVPVEEVGHGAPADAIDDDSYPMAGLSASEIAAIKRARGAK